VKGSIVFGPKNGGGFYQNLQGNFSPLTADRWWMRTWGRLTGTMAQPVEGKALLKQRAAFREALKADRVYRDYGLTAKDIKDDEVLDGLAENILRRYSNEGFKNRSEVNKKAQRLAEGRKRVSEQPTGGGQRSFMRKVAKRAQERLADEGIDIEIADLQALLWYPEKDLYRKYGIGNARSEPTDYETEFSNLARERGVSDDTISAAIAASRGSSRPGSGAAGPGRSGGAESQRQPVAEAVRGGGGQDPQGAFDQSGSIEDRIRTRLSVGDFARGGRLPAYLPAPRMTEAF